MLPPEKAVNCNGFVVVGQVWSGNSICLPRGRWQSDIRGLWEPGRSGRDTSPDFFPCLKLLFLVYNSCMFFVPGLGFVSVFLYIFHVPNVQYFAQVLFSPHQNPLHRGQPNFIQTSFCCWKKLRAATKRQTTIETDSLNKTWESMNCAKILRNASTATTEVWHTNLNTLNQTPGAKIAWEFFVIRISFLSIRWTRQGLSEVQELSCME